MNRSCAGPSSKPARKANFDIEDGLVQLLLRDLATADARGTAHAHDVGALPMLSHALRATWQRSGHGTLTVDDYQASGGISEAVSNTADEVLARCDANARELARQLFLRLVHVGEDTVDTRRRVEHTELVDPDGSSAMAEVLDMFIESRLITVDTDTVEISHGIAYRVAATAVLAHADRDGLRVHRNLTDAARTWRDAGRDSEMLYGTGRLAVVRDWSSPSDQRTHLNPLEREFSTQASRRRRPRGSPNAEDSADFVGSSWHSQCSCSSPRRSAGWPWRRTTANSQRDLAVSRQIAITADRLRATDPALATQLSLLPTASHRPWRRGPACSTPAARW